MQDGTDAPEWIVIDPLTGMLTGAPSGDPPPESIIVRVQAQDPVNSWQTQEVTFNINRRPVVVIPIED